MAQRSNRPNSTSAETVPELSDLPPLLTTAQAAAVLNLPVRTLQKLARRDEIPSVTLGNSYRFSRELIVSMVSEAAGDS
jgi:excisionase family DNA binding protein